MWPMLLGDAYKYEDSVFVCLVVVLTHTGASLHD